jgi:uncharacterized membrane protein YjgN (DUF898 family)
VVLFAALFPWLIYKSLRFMAHNSAYRNVRFSFLGSLKESYSTYLLMPLLMLPTLGIIFPYLVYRQKRYLYGNMAFGGTSNAFNGKAGPFYKYHAVVFALMIGLVVTASLGMGIVTALGVLLVNTSQPPSMSLIVAMVGSFYLLFLLGTTFIRQYLFSRLTNYCWSSSILGGTCFESTLRTRRLFWISLTNILAILFSFGLLFPWAKVRRTRYVVENLSLVSAKGLDEFESASGEQVSAIGDSAMDFFNFEIGL